MTPPPYEYDPPMINCRLWAVPHSVWYTK